MSVLLENERQAKVWGKSLQNSMYKDDADFEDELGGDLDIAVKSFRGLENSLCYQVVQGFVFSLKNAESLLGKRIHDYYKVLGCLLDIHNALVYTFDEEDDILPISDDKLKDLLYELKGFIWPTLEELVGSITEDMAKDEQDQILLACHTIMGGFEALYSTYQYARVRMFQQLECIHDLFELDLEVAYHLRPKRIILNMDWSELDKAYYGDKLVYHYMVTNSVFVTSFINNAIYDLMDEYKGSKVFRKLAIAIENSVAKAIKLSENALANCTIGEKVDSNALDHLEETLEALEERLSMFIRCTDRYAEWYEFDDNPKFIEEALNKNVDLMLGYYKFMVKHYFLLIDIDEYQ